MEEGGNITLLLLGDGKWISPISRIALSSLSVVDKNPYCKSMPVLACNDVCSAVAAVRNYIGVIIDLMIV